MFAPSDWEIEQLLGGINLASTWGKRDYLMILFLCHTGLRIGEMTRLTVELAAHRGEPREELYLPAAITKTRRARTVPLNPVAQMCVAKLMEFNRKRGFSVEPDAPLFPWKRHGFLPRREAERTIQKLRERVGLSAKVTPHTFRHFFATRLLSAGADLATVQALLGHKSVESTQIYTHTTEEKKRAAVMRVLGKGAA
jgi:site-specific recombinase XerD